MASRATREFVPGGLFAGMIYDTMEVTDRRTVVR